MRFAAVVAGVFLGFVGSSAADGPKPDDVSKQRLEFMKSRFGGFELTAQQSPNEPLPWVKEPVLRYSNPERSVLADGTIFVWLAEERPAAAATLWIGFDGGVHREFTSLSDQPLQCVRDGKTIWSPAAGSFTRKPLPGALKPAATPALRLAQMREAASRFTGTFEIKSAKTPQQLRVLPQPIYRYTAEKGAVEGVIFALAHTNDPEVLLVLELTQAPGKPAWHYGVARSSSARLTVSLEKKQVWSVDYYWDNPRSPNDAYQEAGEGRFSSP